MPISAEPSVVTDSSLLKVPPQSDFRSWPSRTIMRLLSPAGNDARLSILIYHRVLPTTDPLFPSEVDAPRFEAQMRTVAGTFRILPLAEAVAGLRTGSLPARAACITFDDGYADNAEVALPILRRLGIPATFFIATGFLNGGRMWNDTIIEVIRLVPGDTLDLSSLDLGTLELTTIADRQRSIPQLLNKLKYLPIDERALMVDRIRSLAPVALPDDLMMSSDQVRQLHSAGMEIGGHTVNHPILARLDSAAARKEMADGKAALEEIIRAPVKLFAYPNGKPGQDYLAEHVAIAREVGFTAAVSTGWGAAGNASDLFQLPRFTPWDQGRTRFMLRLAQNLRQKDSRV